MAMNPDAVATLARALREGIAHPGDDTMPAKVLHLAPLRHSGIPDEMAQEFATQAGFDTNDTDRLLAEGLVSELEQAGLAIIPTAELAALRTQAADTPDGRRTITIYDRTDSQLKQPRLRITIGKEDHVILDVNALARSLGAH